MLPNRPACSPACRAQADGSPRLGFDYGTANNNGNVLSQTITRPGFSATQTYSYDAYNRIQKVQEGTDFRDFAYKEPGNLYVPSWSAGAGWAPASFTPASPGWFNAKNQLVNAQLGITYDAAGNLTAIGGFTFAYDAENRLVSSTLNGVTTNYVYDGEGRRVKKGAVVMVYDAFGRLAAEYGGTAEAVGTEYFTADHLGSTRLVTCSTGAERRCLDYLPFGEGMTQGMGGRGACYASANEPRMKFTGKDRDPETGLDYFGARYFSGAQGRFTSPDPVDHPSKSSFGYDGFLAEPQRWNLYAYALNNPLRYIDENGAEAASIPLGGGRYLVGGQIITVPQRPFREQIAIAAAPAVGLAAAIFAPEAGVAALARFGPAIYNALTRFSNSQTGQELTQSAVETVTNSQAPNLATPTPAGAVKGAYEIALGGGRHAGFLRNYLGKSATELERGIGSLEKQIAIHLDKIKNPGKYIEGFVKLDPRQQKALVNQKWLSDVQRQREQLEILKRLREQQQ